MEQFYRSDPNDASAAFDWQLAGRQHHRYRRRHAVSRNVGICFSPLAFSRAEVYFRLDVKHADGAICGDYDPALPDYEELRHAGLLCRTDHTVDF
ncbi:hypothetical protein D3C76_1650800 [compost metagenome]